MILALDGVRRHESSEGQLSMREACKVAAARIPMRYLKTTASTIRKEVPIALKKQYKKLEGNLDRWTFMDHIKLSITL